ncbi:MAG TPA: hypothetical protein VMH32_03635 [Burkholderiales bacterium]|nr:hypothetical protein [Burkholderiales bacterium]
MSEHEAFLAYAPRGPGLLCAVVYFTLGDSVCGWWTGFRDYGYLPAYFKLEGFYSTRELSLLATEGSDLYGGWRYDYARSLPALEPPLQVDDALAHRLAQLQELFFDEWLFDRSAVQAQEELAAYVQNELAIQDVNIRHKKLNRLDHHGAVWIYRSHGLDGQVIDYLAARWPLDYGKE